MVLELEAGGEVCTNGGRMRNFGEGKKGIDLDFFL
jgi:hypothetical protein